MAKKTTHYVDNAKFKSAMTEYRNSYFRAIDRACEILSESGKKVVGLKIRKRKVEITYEDGVVSYKCGMPEYMETIKAFDKPRMSNYIGKCFMLIATNIATLPCFRSYPFLDEMISDALENMVTYAHNYDAEISPYAFSYFNQFTFRCFCRRITTEKQRITNWNRYVDSATWEAFFSGNCESINDIPNLEQIRFTSAPDKKSRQIQ